MLDGISVRLFKSIAKTFNIKVINANKYSVGINEGTEQYVKTIESYESINYDDDMKLQLN
jgi:hypothetical protein